MPPCMRVPYAGPARVGVGSGDIDQINAALAAAGLPPNEIQSAVTAYTGLDAGATNSLIGIVDGGPVNLTTLGPLIGAGLAATGVGLPIVAAVSAALPILSGIIGMFSEPAETCTWKVGYYCFNKAQPYGPTDPKWETWAAFAGATLDATAIDNWVTFNHAQIINNPMSGPSLRDATGQDHQVGQHPSFVLNAQGGVAHTDALGALPGYIPTIGCELVTLDNSTNLAPQDQFRKAYYRAWQAATEYAINGYKSPDYYALLTASAAAWNRGHAAGSTFTFQPNGSSIPNPLPWQTPCPGGPTYIELLLNGIIDGKDHPPVTIHTGPRTVIAHLHAPTASASRTASSAPAQTSTAAKVAIGAAVVGGGAAVGVGIWAFVTKQAYGEAWDRIWQAAKKPFKTS